MKQAKWTNNKYREGKSEKKNDWIVKRFETRSPISVQLPPSNTQVGNHKCFNTDTQKKTNN